MIGAGWVAVRLDLLGSSTLPRERIAELGFNPLDSRIERGLALAAEGRVRELHEIVCEVREELPERFRTQLSPAHCSLEYVWSADSGNRAAFVQGSIDENDPRAFQIENELQLAAGPAGTRCRGIATLPIYCRIFGYVGLNDQ